MGRYPKGYKKPIAIPQKGKLYRGATKATGERPSDEVQFFFTKSYRTPDLQFTIDWVDAAGNSGRLQGNRIAVTNAKGELEQMEHGIQTEREIVAEVQLMVGRLLARRAARK